MPANTAPPRIPMDISLAVDICSSASTVEKFYNGIRINYAIDVKENWT